MKDGLYEQVINKGLDSELASTDKLSQTAPIDTAEASKVLAKYVAEVVERGLDNLRDNGGDLNAQVALANQIITTIQAETKEAAGAENTKGPACRKEANGGGAAKGPCQKRHGAQAL